MNDERAAEILDYWFAGADKDPQAAMARNRFWYGSSDRTDNEIGRRFAALVNDAVDGQFVHWMDAPQTALALVVTLDQFPRNLWRGTSRAFSCDERALHCAQTAVAAGYRGALTPPQQVFLLMPYQHSESADVQDDSVALYKSLLAAVPPEWADYCRGSLSYARQHRDLIQRFGRFPHRNALLGRPSTAAERAFLDDGGATFGQQAAT